MSDLTVIYYTSNRECEEFESRIRQNIVDVCGSLPIICVSQKLVDFPSRESGYTTYITVGDVGASGFNMFRQVQIACECAKTKFVISAEADCLYPPDYFLLAPPRDDLCYRNRNLYVMPQHRAFFWQKLEGATHAQVVGRDFYLRRLEHLFKGAPDWNAEEKNFPKERLRKEDVFDQISYYETVNPVVQIKTSQSMRHYTNSTRVDVHELPYWGTGPEFRRKWYDIGRRH